MKGPLAVLQTGAGNDWDTDSLLVQLFSAAGVGGLQYVTTQIIEPLATVENWLGVQSSLAVNSALYQAGLRPTMISSVTTNPPTVVAASSPTVQYAQFDHTWLQGTIAGQAVYLDPTWKFRDFQPGIPGIPTAVPFDAGAEANYLSQVRSELPYQWYEDQVSGYLAGHDPSQTIADVPYTGPIHQRMFTALPANVPYFEYYSGAETFNSTIPQQYEYRVQISETLPQGGSTVTSAVYNALMKTTTVTVSSTPFTSALVNTPLVISETGGEQAFNINSVSTSNQVVVAGNASGATFDSYAISVVSARANLPDVSLRRLTVFTGTSSAAPGIYLDGTTNSASMDYLVQDSAPLSGNNTQPVNVIIQVFAAGSPQDGFGQAGYSQSYTHVYDRTAEMYLAIGLDANQTSPQMLANIRSVVNQANINQADNSSWMSQNAANQDQLIGGLLQLAVMEYFNEADTGENEIAGLTQAVSSAYDYVATGIAGSSSLLQTTIPATTQGELEFPYLPQNMVIDLPNDGWWSLSLTGDTSQRHGPQSP